MSKLSTFISIGLFAFASIASGQMANGVAEQPEDAGNQQNYILTSNKVPEGYPLKIKETHGGNIGIIHDFDVKPFVYTLKNISDKPVKNITVQSTCNCVRLAAPIDNRTLAPGEELPIHFTVSGAHIRNGKFDRVILLIAENFPPVKLGVIGENIPLVDFTPAVCIDLGNFHGFTPFKRTFVIKTRLDDDKLKLGQPEENKYFDAKITKTAPQTYTVEVSSKKLQLPSGRLAEKIIIPAIGVEHYGPIFVALKGHVTHPRFRLEKSRITITPQDIPEKGPYKTSLELQLLSLGKLRQSSSQEKRPDLVSQQPVSVEEMQDNSLDKLETWQLFANDLTFGSVPNGVTIEKIPRANGLDIQLTISEDYLKTMQTFSFYAKYGRMRIGVIQCTKMEQ